MSKIKIYFALLFAIMVAYFGSLKYGFSQDDWYFLYISAARNLGDVLNFFNPWTQSGFAFYRPLGTQLYYYLSRLIFGLGNAPYAMHIFMIIAQSVSSYNVYRLVQKLTRDNHLSFLSALIYATSSVHFLSLYYIAATQQLLATSFALLAINDFLDHKSIRSSLWFALGLMSKEVAIVAPIVMILSQYKLDGKFEFKKIFFKLVPLAVIGIIYLGMKFLGGMQVQSEYHFVLNGSVLSTIRWYYLFGYGAPEELVRYGLPRMAVDYYSYFKDFGTSGLVTSLIPITISIYVLARTILGFFGYGSLKRRDIIVYICWWLLTLAPILFLQDHRYPHYVDLALIPMILLALEKIGQRNQLILTSLLIIVSLFSISLSQQSHWTVNRALISKSAVELIEARQDCSRSIWYVTGQNDAPKQLSYALSLENGPRVICNNPSLQVYYQGMSVGDIPTDSLILNTDGILGL